MPQPIRQTVLDHDLTARFASSTTVAASPAAGAETTIASVTIPNFGDLQVVSGIRVFGWAAFTVGTSGISATLQIKQTNSSGSAVVSSGAITETAANLDEVSVMGFDSGAGVKTYALTLTIGSGAAASTVSAVYLGVQVF